MIDFIVYKFAVMFLGTKIERPANKKINIHNKQVVFAMDIFTLIM